MSDYFEQAQRLNKLSREELRKVQAETAAEVKTTIICRRLQKGDSFQHISTDFKMSEELAASVFQILEKYAPDYDVQEVLAELKKQELALLL